MFQVFLFILFTAGNSELVCKSSDLEISYTFCDSVLQTFMFNITPCTMVNKPIWNVVLTWIPRSDINFLKVVFKVWFDGARALDWKKVLCSGADDEYAACGALKGDKVLICACLTLPHGTLPAQALNLTFTVNWKLLQVPMTSPVIGETFATTFDIKGARTMFPKGKYTIILQGFSDDSEKNMLLCLNFTMIVKKEAL